MQNSRLPNLRFIESMLTPPGMLLPIRTVIVELDGKEIILSPGSKLTQGQLHPQWPVSDIVAPNLFHYAGVPNASRTYPNARLWYAKGVEKKCKTVKWTSELSAKTWPYQEELTLFCIEGMAGCHENVFIHKASRSLIVADLCFNMVGYHGFVTRLVLGMFGTYDRFGISRYFMKHGNDKDLFQSSMKRLLSSNFENIILSHGSNLLITKKVTPKELLKNALIERGLKLS
jgi:hypothetical protein